MSVVTLVTVLGIVLSAIGTPWFVHELVVRERRRRRSEARRAVWDAATEPIPRQSTRLVKPSAGRLSYPHDTPYRHLPARRPVPLPARVAR